MLDSREDVTQDFFLLLLQEAGQDENRKKHIEQLARQVYARPSLIECFDQLRTTARVIDYEFGGWPMLYWRWCNAWRKQDKLQMSEIKNLSELDETKASAIEKELYSDSEGDPANDTYR